MNVQVEGVNEASRVFEALCSPLHQMEGEDSNLGREGRNVSNLKKGGSTLPIEVGEEELVWKRQYEGGCGAKLKGVQG